MNPDISSTHLFKTAVPSTEHQPRRFYLKEYYQLPSPWIAHSKMVPIALIEDLMREKRDTAIGEKFIKNNHPPDRITNMEAAMHTFVTPIVEATIHGDYQWKGGHSIHRFGSTEGRQLGRPVLMSALVQQDYEDDYVMARVASLRENEIIGTPEFPELMHWSVKQTDARRRSYNTQILMYLIYHLTQSHRLPAISAVGQSAMTVNETLDFLYDTIKHQNPSSLPSYMRGRYISYQGHILSLEVIFMTSVHQNKNEFCLLELLCSKRGYVYTFNPPAIFASFFGSRGTELLGRIHVAALKYVQSIMDFQACKCIAWSDYADSSIIQLIKYALDDQPHVGVVSSGALFSAGKDIKEGRGEGLYWPPKVAENAMLVIHNNSDAFGQNIETEGAGGSLDGVIGAFSSAAGSLLRHRKDLCQNLFCVK
jgi:hypothetical protein